MRRKEFIQSTILAAGLSMAPSSLVAKSTVAKRSFRFAFMSDIHIKPGAKPEAGMSSAIRHIQNLKPKVDFIINGGRFNNGFFSSY